jgi:DNA primase
MFPIHNPQGKIVGFSARTIEKDLKGAKYVNSPETPIFKKSRVLYGFSLARKAVYEKGFVILCEGQLDVIAMHRAGFENSVAPQGTAFTDEQARLLKRYTQSLYVSFDSDGAGIEAAKKVISIVLPLDMGIKIMSFPEGKDPDEIYGAQGREGIENIVEAAVDFFEFLFRDSCIRHNSETPEGKGNIVSELKEFIVLIENSVTRSSYASRLAGLLSIPEQAVFDELSKVRRPQKSKAQESRDDYVERPKKKKKNLNQGLMKAEETLLELALAHGTVGHRIAEELPDNMLSDTPVGRALELTVQMTMLDEWEFVPRKLAEDMIENPDPSISRILADPVQYDHKGQEKAVGDCIKIIRKFHIQDRMEELKNRLKEALSDEEKAEVLKEFQEKSRELMLLGKASKDKA